MKQVWKWVVFSTIFLVALILVVIGVLAWNRDNETNMSAQEIDEHGFPSGKHFIEHVKEGEVISFVDSEERPSDPTGKRHITTTRVPDKDGKHMVAKQTCDRDGRVYYVSAELPDRLVASRKLAEVRRRTEVLIYELKRMLNRKRRLMSRDGKDITRNIRKLIRSHEMREVPLSEYHNPYDSTVGSNCDKGVLIEVCLRSKRNPGVWNSDNTIFRVHVHELAHSSDFQVRGDGHAAHGKDFYRLQTYLLIVAQRLRIYSKQEYAKSNGKFCGLHLTETDDF